MKVIHEYSEIVAGADYYPFGLEIEDRKITREDYRFGYQGNFSEKDSLTGWNHFKFRQYDPKIGRWLQRDPEGQFHSPYNAMGNNPVTGTDPTGGKNYNFSAKTGAYLGVTFDVFWHNALFGSRGVLIDSRGVVTKTFSFSDVLHDTKELDEKVITRLIFVKKSEILEMLVNAGAFKKENRDKPLSYILREGRGGGKFDFAHDEIFDMYPGSSLSPNFYPSQYLYLIGNMAYNQSNFGNFMFGAGGVTLGVPITMLLTGAHYNSLFNADPNGYDSQLDAKDDQWAIIYGGSYAYWNTYPSKGK